MKLRLLFDEKFGCDHNEYFRVQLIRARRDPWYLKTYRSPELIFIGSSQRMAKLNTAAAVAETAAGNGTASVKRPWFGKIEHRTERQRVVVVTDQVVKDPQMLLIMAIDDTMREYLQK